MLLNQQLNAYEHVHLRKGSNWNLSRNIFKSSYMLLDGIVSKHKYMQVYVLSLFKSLQ